MRKVSVSNFDTDVCMGDHPAVDGPCPHKAAKGESTDSGVVDTLARVETEVIDTVSGDGGDTARTSKCGLCGCPLVNLALTGQAPEDCPRLANHQ